MSLAGTLEQKDVAYCVSTVGLTGIAEIDSIYVAERYRNNGLGGKLIKGALDWRRT